MQAEVKIFSSWESLLEYYTQTFKGEQAKTERGYDPIWLFRGQSNDKWDLTTSLERAVLRFDKHLGNALKIESGLLRKFQRHFQHYETSLPEKSDTVEWLAIMQHHSSPTRLLDWTYSFYIALYFALETSTGASVVWAVDARWCTNRAMKMLAEHGKSISSKHSPRHELWQIKKLANEDRSISFAKDGLAFDEVFRSERSWFPFVYPMTPLRLNQRLIYQQGSFLCPSDPTRTFWHNLSSMEPEPTKFKKLIINPTIREEALRGLYRMNITRATLFPGLDGFARSLEHLILFPEILYPSNVVIDD